MRQISKKRQKENAQYTRVKKEIRKELIDRGEWKCFFTWEDIPEGILPSFHHLDGRDGDLMVDKDNLVPCYDGAHRAYHDLPIDKLEKFGWWPGFMRRLKEKNKNVYNKIMARHDKG